MSKKPNPLPEEENQSRRSMLKSLVVGSAMVTGSQSLPDQWRKPLTDSVILPSHGRTSGDMEYGDGYASGGENDYGEGGQDAEYGDFCKSDIEDEGTADGPYCKVYY